MATKTVKKNNMIPKISQKWYDFKIDSKTLRPIRFAWYLTAGLKEIFIYKTNNKSETDILDVKINNYVNSYYFVLDRRNKRIFAYPIILTNNRSRSTCHDAKYIKADSNIFYMWDENKQLWEVPYEPYQKYVRYDWHTRETIFEDITGPKKISRLSTYWYRVQAQLPSYIRSIFSELYGKDFVYQNQLVTDTDIRQNSWQWYGWLSTKGRKYSDKTIKATDALMNSFSNESRINEESENISSGAVNVTLETNNDITAVCYFSKGRETFRQIYNPKTKKIDSFVWKNDKWSKTGNLSRYQFINSFTIQPSYQNTHEYDYKFFQEAKDFYACQTDRRGYWYNVDKQLYQFILKYLEKPVIHQLLQIQSEQARNEMYKHGGDIQYTYGNIPNKGKTMFAKLGINKYQFNNPSVIVYMKWLLNQNNISHIDSDTWDKCCDAFTGESMDRWYDQPIIDFLQSKNEFSIDRWIKICQLNAKAKSGYGNPVKQLYKDYYTSLSTLDEFGTNISAYPLLFNTTDQLRRFHDEAARAVSSVKNKAQDVKFEMLYAKREKMLENDGKYIITMPKCAADLTEEGSKLHHCVGGYINNVANGVTAIYFLRQASNPTAPWLTVEVRNKTCAQIHGACNAWMGSKDEYFDAVPFLVWWFDKHDIIYDNNLLTNKATGYSSINSNRAMPTADIEAYKQSKKLKKSS